MDTKHLNTLAGQIRLYIERVLPQLERAGGFPDSPMDRDAKGESNPPVGDRALLLWWVNRDAGAVLNPLLRELGLGRESYGSHYYRDMFEFAVYDSGAFVRWLSASNAGAKRRQAFWVMCLHIARVAIIRHGASLRLEVESGPLKDADGGIVIDPTAKPDEVGDPRTIAPKWRTITANDAYWRIVARLEKIRLNNPDMEERDVEKECQKELEALGLSGSIGRIRDAKTFVNAERGNGDAA